MILAKVGLLTLLLLCLRLVVIAEVANNNADRNNPGFDQDFKRSSLCFRMGLCILFYEEILLAELELYSNDYTIDDFGCSELYLNNCPNDKCWCTKDETEKCEAKVRSLTSQYLRRNVSTGCPNHAKLNCSVWDYYFLMADCFISTERTNYIKESPLPLYQKGILRSFLKKNCLSDTVTQSECSKCGK